MEQRLVTYDEYRRHKHDGIETDEIPNRTEMPRSFPVTANVGDSTTTITTDDVDRIFTYENASHFLLALGGSKHYQRRDTSSDWAAIDNIWGAFKLGDYVYVLLQDTGVAPAEFRIYRYSVNDLSAGGTLCTFAGTAPDLTVAVNLRLACDGTNLYLNYDGGNSANAYKIAKYSVNGTELTYQSTITCGAATLGFNQGFAVRKDGSIYTIDTTNRNISKFDDTGTLQYTDDATTLPASHEHLCVIEDTLYCFSSTSKHFEKMFYT